MAEITEAAQGNFIPTGEGAGKSVERIGQIERMGRLIQGGNFFRFFSEYDSGCHTGVGRMPGVKVEVDAGRPR